MNSLLFTIPNLGIFDDIIYFFTNNSYENLKRAVAAVIIFFAFVFLRNIFVKYIFKIVGRLISKTRFVLDTKFLQAFEGPLKSMFIVFAVIFALATLGKNYKISSDFIHKCLNSCIITLLALGFINLADESSGVFTDIKDKFDIKIDNILIPFLSKSIKLIIAIFAISIVLDQWHIDIKMIITGIGIGGLAISLAAKDAAANVIAGVTLILEKTFDIGDYVSINQIEGVVQEISFRSTRIRTMNQELITIPNSTVANAPIINFTRRDKRRLSFSIGVTYSTTKEKLDTCVKKIEKMINGHEGIHSEETIVVFDNFGASSLNINITCYTTTAELNKHLKIKEDINFKIIEILQSEGVEMAFPSSSIYFETPLKCESVSDVLDDSCDNAIS